MSKIQQWSVAAALGCVLVLAIGWFGLVSAQRAQASKLRAQATSQQQQDLVLGNELQARRAQSKNLPAEQALLAEYAARIPATPGLPSLIRELSKAAAGAGVDLKSLSPATPTLLATTSPAAATAGGLAQITVSLQIVGTYYNVEEFVNSLEHLGRSMVVSALSLAPGGSPTAATTSSTSSSAPAAPTAAGQSPNLTATITARVFMNAQPAAAGSAPAAPANK